MWVRAEHRLLHEALNQEAPSVERKDTKSVLKKEVHSSREALGIRLSATNVQRQKTTTTL